MTTRGSGTKTMITAGNLRVEHLPNPLGIDVATPSFSWTPNGTDGTRQTAFEICVGTDAARVAEGGGDLWSSGPVIGDNAAGIQYAGEPLQSRQRFWWSVRLFNDNGVGGRWADPAWFEMGLLAAEDWSADWIEGDADVSSPLLRRSFDLGDDPVVAARTYVCGLGNFVLSVNGRRVGKSVLDPAATTFSHDPDLKDSKGAPTRIKNARILYVVHDVTGLLVAGENALGIMLGHGWYSAEKDVLPAPYGRTPYGERPCALVQVEVEHASGRRSTIVSDGSWRTAAGPIRYNDLCHGETFDGRARLSGWDTPGFDDADWSPAKSASSPDGTLRAQATAPVEVVETLQARSVQKVDDKVVVVDFGQHISGWTAVTVSGEAGSRVTLRYGGRVDADGRLDNSSNMMKRSQARQVDTYILSGEAHERYEPSFTCHGFRYVEIILDGEVALHSTEAAVVQSAVAHTGAFHCSDALLNQIHANVGWTLRASMQGGPQDAADRAERMPWLGDPGWVIDEYLYNFDGAAFWMKWLDDIRDCQLPDGNLPFVCPLHWRGPLPGALKHMSDLPYATWPDFSTATYPIIAWKLFEYYGDRSILERHFTGMAEALGFMETEARDHIIERGFGEHMEPQADGTCSVQTDRTPVALTTTAWYHHVTSVLSKAAGALGKTDDAERYAAQAEAIQRAFGAAFIDNDTGTLSGGSQSALALTLWLGAAPAAARDRIFDALLADIEGRGGLATGTMGTAALEHVLGEGGRADVMLRIAQGTDYPSWGHQIAQGATTIWETWAGEPERSLNMKLLASIDVFLYRDVAGISLLEPGWRRMRVRPAVTELLRNAHASVMTPRGSASVRWVRQPDRLVVDVDVPPTSEAEIWMPFGPGDRLIEATTGQLAWHEDGALKLANAIADAEQAGPYLRFTAIGGQHTFLSSKS